MPVPIVRRPIPNANMRPLSPIPPVANANIGGVQPTTGNKIVPVDIAGAEKAKKDEALRLARIQAKKDLTAKAKQNAADAAAKAEEERPKTNEDFDKAASDMLYNEINQAGNVDTKAEEDLINEQMNDRIGAALVDQRASMGRSGFGSSGALAAMEGDTQRTARQQGLEDVLGLRRTEDQRATDNATKAIGSELSMRKQAEAEAKQAALLAEIEKGNEDINADDDGPRSNPNGTEKDLDQATEDKYEAAPKRGLQWTGDRQIGNVVIDGIPYGVFHSNDPNGENDDEGTYLVKSWYQNPNDPKNQES